MHERIKDLKIKHDKNTLQSNPFGIVPAAWNAFVDTVSLLVKGGVALRDAIQSAIKKHNITASNGQIDAAYKMLNGDEDAPKIEAKVNIAPLFSTKVATVEQANEIIGSDFYKKYKKDVEALAKAFGVEIVGSEDGIGGYEGVSEATTYYTVRAKSFDNIVDFAAVIGALTPEVQDSTIAGMFVKSGSDGHNADKVEVEVDNPALAFKALAEAGFVQDGYTLTGGTVHLFDFSKGEDAEFKQKYVNFINKFKQYGGQIKSEETWAIRSEYIDSERRGEILEQIEGTRLQHGQGRSSLHNAIREATARNKAYQKFKKALDSPDRKRLTELRAKQIDGTPLTLKERSDIKRLEKKIVAI